MKDVSKNKFEIRRAHPAEFEMLGKMTVEIYEQLPGMPSRAEQPAYYAMLYDVCIRASQPAIEILVAVTCGDKLLGGVTFVGDMAYYGSGGTASAQADSSGIRLLAVHPDARRLGVGKELTNACIQRAVSRGSAQVILHTTKAMQIAWGMYARMGFSRSMDLDFRQGELAVYGFRLSLDSFNSGRVIK